MRSYAKKNGRPVGGCPIPKDLTTLAYRAVLVELQHGDNLTDLHGYVHRLLANNVPLVLCGSDAEMMAMRQSLLAAMGDEGLQAVDVALHQPNHNPNDRFRFRVLRLTLLTTKPLAFRVHLFPAPSLLVVARQAHRNESQPLLVCLVFQLPNFFGCFTLFA